jgi:hypothetical protein
MFSPVADLVIDSKQTSNDITFDGVTCNDKYSVISLDYGHSYLNFSTPALGFNNN